MQGAVFTKKKSIPFVRESARGEAVRRWQHAQMYDCQRRSKTLLNSPR